jgi:hypothetical protein
VVGRLSRSATAALGTGAYALASASISTLAAQSTWLRMVAVALLSVLLILVSLVTAPGLWEPRMIRRPVSGSRSSTSSP